MYSYPVYFQNKIIDKREVKLDFISPAVQYGIHPFEGISCLNINNKNYFFRLKEHINRLINSCNKLGIEIENNFDELFNKSIFYIKTINPNEDLNIRLSVFPLEGSWSSELLIGTVLISGFSTATQLLAKTQNQLNLKLTRITKTSKQSIDQSIKVGANYLNARYAHLEATKEKYDSCLLADDNGFISESGGSNIFFIKNKTLYTPSYESNILHGITRDTIIEIAKIKKLNLRECKIKKNDLYDFESAFLCGTSMKIKPISRIDNLNFDTENDFFLEIQKLYLDALYKPGTFNMNWHSEV